ncbi:MAG: ROK family protein [Deltaproteobacteria bacterium]|nr:ROK family protein [Deltaproteobacteria bacterium]
MKYSIGVDLGGTKTEIVLCGDNPLETIERLRVPTLQKNGYPALVKQLSELILSYIGKCSSLPSIGIGIPGSLESDKGLVRNSNIQCLIKKPLKADLEKIINHSVRLENDANCFALSEARFGAGKAHGVVMGIIMGTGLGGGLVISGKVLGGHQGIAGEWGHSTIDLNGLDCWCGRKGCLEQYLSGTGLENLYFRKSGVKKSAQDICRDSMEKKEAAARETLDEFLSYFGEGIANLIVCIDPDIVVLGGGLSNLPLLYDEGVAQVRKRLFNRELSTPIVQNLLGDSSGIFGAVIAGMNQGDFS